jgi:hypothetical protein
LLFGDSMGFIGTRLNSQFGAGIVVSRLWREPAPAKEIEWPSTIQRRSRLIWGNSRDGALTIRALVASTTLATWNFGGAPGESNATKLKKLDVYDFVSGLTDEI